MGNSWELRAFDGIKVIGVKICASAVRLAADLSRIPFHTCFHDLFAEGRVVAAKAGDRGTCWLL
jgi:hypothetical protein